MIRRLPSHIAPSKRRSERVQTSTHVSTYTIASLGRDIIVLENRQIRKRADRTHDDSEGTTRSS
jgi:hypothetical protein